MMNATIVWKELSPPEGRRTYVFSNKLEHDYYRVKRLGIDSDKNHYLELENGQKHIVANKWLTLTIDSKNWNV